ncbi:hypothetical protein SAMN05518865_13023 [Duganella sp. CF458]|uniref:hypothetical protein n=1 Tax=Duganella sp. CF458 TaxID=1884368 RepID=UPI0008DEBF41|nr:hypothetical protein [Duganella sp. CF458]SFH01604.1 hypothetical protein SAMN05518865_13023 [Duganella sp. CF458]
MEPNQVSPRINFPQIADVKLENFDLYTQEPNAAVSITRPVFCLIGANGLGKSTFLNTVNYVITGAVPDPARSFQSANDYFKNASRVSRTEEYFNGRISESRRKLAQATVRLTWPQKTISITRPFFDGPGISKMEIVDVGQQTTKIWLADENNDPSDLLKEYEAQILELTGLNDFPQFAFLLHFVATFDEGRHLLTWDDSALTNAMYLAFGGDSEAAKAADRLQHDMERESSKARNVRYAARHVSEQIEQLIAILPGEESSEHITESELKLRYDELTATHGNLEQRVRAKQSELRDCDMKWTQLSAALTEAQLQYRQLFSNRVKKTNAAEHHPIVRATLIDDICAICSSSGVSALIRSKLNECRCPLCDSELPNISSEDDVVGKLKELDEKIITIRNELNIVLTARERISIELSATEKDEADAFSRLRNFEEKESSWLTKSNANSNTDLISTQIEKLESERKEFFAQSEAHYKKRDELRKKLHAFEKDLKSRYEICSQKFVPRFRELAEEFIGLPVDVELEHRQGVNASGFGLRLRMNDKLRLSADKLSESQRFFIDIALRMALLEFMSVGQSTILIDTPEGSLDIAYEARAGAMFSKYVEGGNRILMTANLRSSELVLRLAKSQRSAGMQIVRMTDWTDLTQVQQSEEDLFTKAYGDIEQALI